MLELLVKSITREAEGIHAYELVDPAGAPLPPFAAGSHIDVHLPGGFVRQYSLCNDPRERHRYLIGVLNVADGRGGSAAFHRSVHAGDRLCVSVPKNNFALNESAASYLLLAGGIGITPMLAMVARLDAIGARYTLHYCTRTPERTAFRERLAPLVAAGKAFHHFDRGDPANGLALDELLGEPLPGTHLYYCGPAGMMAAAAAASAHWPADSVHSEYFSAPPQAAAAGEAGSEAFDVRLERSGRTLHVPAGRTIIDVLRDAGVQCETSCEAGICGTCRTRYLDGFPDHRDFVLDDEEREQYLLICCARAKSELLVLDL